MAELGHLQLEWSKSIMAKWVDSKYSNRDYLLTHLWVELSFVELSGRDEWELDKSYVDVPKLIIHLILFVNFVSECQINCLVACTLSVSSVCRCCLNLCLNPCLLITWSNSSLPKNLWHTICVRGNSNSHHPQPLNPLLGSFSCEWLHSKLLSPSWCPTGA